MIWLKYCGICRAEDFNYAVALSIDAIGLICVPNTPRFVTDSELSELVSQPRSASQLTLVFQDAPKDIVEERISIAKPDMLQFHGNETPEFAESFGLPYLKATRDANALSMMFQHRKAFAWLIDAPDFETILINEQDSRPIVIAGGLTAENIETRLKHYRPFGVDLSRGIEKCPREKDHMKMKHIAKLVREGRKP